MASGFIYESGGFGVSGTLGFRRSDFDPALTPFGRIAGVIALLLVLCACLWAVAEYAEQKAEIRRAETDRYIQAFEAGPVADAWEKLHRTWDVPGARTYGLRAEALEADLETEIGLVLGYFRGFAFCVRAGNCDADRARMYLGDRPLRFREQHQAILETSFAGVPLARDLQTLVPQEHTVPAGP
jgi:hypothetical protein